MAKIDLKPLSLAELKALQARVEKAIARYDKKAKAEALAAVKAKAKTMGFKLEELVGDAPAAKKAKPAKKKAAVAYRDPNNSANTWGGRGARPAWLREALDGGASLDSFKV